MKLSLQRTLAAAFLIPGVVLSVGCAKKTIVGKWTGSTEYPMLGAVTATIEYKEGGVMTQTASTKMGQIDVTGTYKAEGENLTVTVTDIKAGGNSVMAMLPAQAKQGLNTTATFKLEGDTLTVTRQGKAQTFTHVKE